MKISPTKCAAILIVISAAIVCQKTQARPIVGSIDFGGVVSFDTMSLATATRANSWTSSFVLQDFGDFSSVSPGTHATMASPWIFNPSTSTPSLWSVGGYTFDLTSSTIVRQDANFLNITGVGTVSSTTQGLDPTPGLWSFSVSNSNGSNSASFGFQATTDAVPEPTATALFALTGLAWCGSRYFQRLRKKTRIFAVGCGPL
jgi:hypothetical protein